MKTIIISPLFDNTMIEPIKRPSSTYKSPKKVQLHKLEKQEQTFKRLLQVLEMQEQMEKSLIDKTSSKLADTQKAIVLFKLKTPISL